MPHGPLLAAFLTLALPGLPAIAKPAATTAAKSCEHDDRSFRCVKFVRNYDGDTITFDIPGVHALIGNKISVRVAHLDTPEVRGKLPCEKEAARTAQRLIENLLKNSLRIDLENVARDKSFRILADVKVDGLDLKEVLLKNKLAYAYEGGTKRKTDWCKVGRSAADE